MVGSSNAVNLTDGLDGLAIGCVVVAAGALTVLTYVTSHAGFSAYLDIQHLPQVGELTIFCGALVGASLAFLWYNAHPADVFMGDVGSLALGGSIGLIAVAIKQEILLFSVGGIFVLEALSVILQVASFRLTGQAHFPHVAAAPSFRAGRLERIENHRALLDCGAGLCAVFADDAEVEVDAGCESGHRTRTGKRVLVVGLARTGVATALFCAARGARVTATEERAAAQLGRRCARNCAPPAARSNSAAIAAKHSWQQDLIVPSPGVPATHAGAGGGARRGHSDLERDRTGLALSARPAGGHHRLERQDHDDLAASATFWTGAGMPVLVAGNIGTPLIARVDESSDAQHHGGRSQQLPARTDRFVSAGHRRAAQSHARSSRPARLVRSLRPRQGAHLRKPDRARRRRAQRRRSWRSRSMRPRGRRVYLVQPQQARGQRRLSARRSDCFPPRWRRDTAAARARHRLARRAQSSKMFWPRRPPRFLRASRPRRSPRACAAFPGVEHRLEFVAEIGGVSFFNDSKATNVDATLKALDAFPGGLLVILGGKDKGSDYAPLRRAAARSARALVLLIGAAAEKIDAQLGGRCRRSSAPERSSAPWRWRSNARGPATPCCSRRPAPVSISLRITSIADASSSNWCARSRKRTRGLDARAGRKG